MEGGDSQNTTILQGLGIFKIWTTLIFIPLSVLALIVAMIFFSQYQKNWKVSTATAVAAVKDCPVNVSDNQKGWTCAVKVKVADLPQDNILDLKVEVNQSSVDINQTWQVTYDPAKPTQTLTTAVLTSGTRTGIEIGLAVGILLCVVFFVVNLVFRKNKTWQNVSGVMEGVDLASSLMRR
jgi:flagellar biosynthesis protein FliP